MIDIRKEKIVPVAKSSRHFPNNPSQPSVWRYALKGVGGKKLETVKIGGQRYTSVEAIERFCTQDGGVDAAPEARTPRARQAAIAAAERELAAAGV